MEPAKLWTKNFVLCTFVNFLLMLNYYLLITVMTQYTIETYGAGSGVAGLSASIFVIGTLAARLFAGSRLEQVGHKRLVLIGAVLVFAMSGVYMIVDQIAILFAIRLIHGAAYGLLATALGTVVTETVPESKRGEGIGYYMLSNTLGAAVGPFCAVFIFISTAVTDVTFSYVSFCAVIALISVFLLNFRVYEKTAPVCEERWKKRCLQPVDFWRKGLADQYCVCADLFRLLQYFVLPHVFRSRNPARNGGTVFLFRLCAGNAGYQTLHRKNIRQERPVVRPDAWHVGICRRYAGPEPHGLSRAAAHRGGFSGIWRRRYSISGTGGSCGSGKRETSGPGQFYFLYLFGSGGGCWTVAAGLSSPLYRLSRHVSFYGSIVPAVCDLISRNLSQTGQRYGKSCQGRTETGICI